ncbi:hypothetical protein EIP91_003757 [Steccherinum ochraceum]|uniref:F-box domain-containing protein n=1 Tax=Steccherinum ochraceum TaxID=92696 RepID=A0A4R0RQM6_9APHY|nr:hypothetical protein EIP91_003757 [Steccherinum ochraceum]
MFRESCLNELWYHQDGIVQLLFMVSAIRSANSAPNYKNGSFHRYRRSAAGNKAQWLFRRSLQPEDVDAMLFYSSRVREMYFTSTTGLIRLGFLPRDVPMLPGTVIFPQLRVLAWTYGGGSSGASSWSLDFVLDKTGDKLTEMAGQISDRSRTRFLDGMQVRRHHLSYLSLCDRDAKESTRDATSHFFRDVLPGAHNLRELHLNTAFPEPLDVWGVILKLPCLNKLSLIGTAPPAAQAVSHTLTCVTMNSDDAHLFPPIFDNIRFTGLRQLELSFYEDYDLPNASVVPFVRSLLSSIAASCADSPLTSLTVYSHEADVFIDLLSHDDIAPADPNIIRDGLGLDDLRPFMQRYPKLEVFDLTLGCHWEARDDILEEVGRAWGSTLRILRLDPHISWRMSSQCMTLPGLEQFAACCPSLTTLGVHFTDTLPEHSTLPVHMRLNRSGDAPSRLAHVGSSPLDPLQMNEMAQHLSDLFPGLGTVETAPQPTGLNRRASD